MLCPSELNSIHGNEIEFGCKLCRICHLGRLPTIIIDVILFDNAVFEFMCVVVLSGV